MIFGTENAEIALTQQLELRNSRDAIFWVDNETKSFNLGGNNVQSMFIFITVGYEVIIRVCED